MSGHGDHPGGGSRAARRSRRLRRIPLPVRGAAYYVCFLAFLLVLLPWVAHRLAERLAPWRLELGRGRAAGWVMLAAGWLLYTIASVVLMRRGGGAYVEFDPPQRFVTAGPYRWCRNPIAACVLAMLLGEALAFSSLGILLLALAAALLAHLQIVLLEEPLLRKRFGQAYLDYLARVPRWIPRPPRGAPP